jgi:hypothetical protein
MLATPSKSNAAANTTHYQGDTLMFHATRFYDRFALNALKAIALLAVLAPTLGHAQVAQVKKSVSFAFQTDTCHWIVINGLSLTFRVPQTQPGLARADFSPRSFIEWNACTGSIYSPVIGSVGWSATTVNSGRNYNFSGSLSAAYGTWGLGLQVLYTGRFNIRERTVEVPTATLIFFDLANPTVRLEVDTLTTIASWD